MQRIESLIAQWRADASSVAPEWRVVWQAFADQLEEAYHADMHEGHRNDFAVGCKFCRDELRELTGPIPKIAAEGIDRAAKS